MAENKYESSGLICFRCGREFNWGEKFISLEGNLEVASPDKTIECLENSAISSLCFSCAIILLNEAVINKKLIMPRQMLDLFENCELDSTTNPQKEDIPQLKLTMKEHFARILKSLVKAASFLGNNDGEHHE